MSFTFLLVLHVGFGFPSRGDHVVKETNPFLTIIHKMTVSTESLRATNVTDPILGSSNIILPILAFHLTCGAMIGFITAKKHALLFATKDSTIRRNYHINVVMFIAIPTVGKGIVGFKASFHASSWLSHTVLIGIFKCFFDLVNIETSKETTKGSCSCAALES